MAAGWSGNRDGPCLRVAGEWDMSNTCEVRKRLLDEVAEGATDFDLCGLSFCGAAGMHALHAAHGALRARDTTMQVMCPAFTRQVLEICKMHDLEGFELSTSSAEP